MLSFAKNMSKNFGKDTSENLSDKYSQNIVDYTKKKSGTDTLKLFQKQQLKETPEATGNFKRKK